MGDVIPEQALPADQGLPDVQPVPELSVPTRAGRALIGWMPTEQGVLTLSGRRMDAAINDSLREQVETAQAAVAEREPGIDQEGIVEALPPGLDGLRERLRAQPNAIDYFRDGWDVKVVDLSRVCSLQQQVFSEHAIERVSTIDIDDLGAIGDLTLPPPEETPLPAQFDEVRSAWMIHGANPNLRITGHFSGQIQPGVIGFGFTVGVLASFVQVARHHGRYVLRDGYHRAYGLLERGVTRAPVFVRDFGFADLGATPGLFGTDVYLGERPPVLPDFHNDEVAADVQIPASQKMLVIPGLELTPVG
jgi:hypothetical protein